MWNVIKEVDGFMKGYRFALIWMLVTDAMRGRVIGFDLHESGLDQSLLDRVGTDRDSRCECGYRSGFLCHCIVPTIFEVK
jgi:hypothetical protein